MNQKQVAALLLATGWIIKRSLFGRRRRSRKMKKKELSARIPGRPRAAIPLSFRSNNLYHRLLRRLRPPGTHEEGVCVEKDQVRGRTPSQNRREDLGGIPGSCSQTHTRSPSVSSSSSRRRVSRELSSDYRYCLSCYYSWVKGYSQRYRTVIDTVLQSLATSFNVYIHPRYVVQTDSNQGTTPAKKSSLSAPPHDAPGEHQEETSRIEAASHATSPAPPPVPPKHPREAFSASSSPTGIKGIVSGATESPRAGDKGVRFVEKTGESEKLPTEAKEGDGSVENRDSAAVEDARGTRAPLRNWQSALEDLTVDPKYR